MKLALCTTTIRVPRALALYRALGPEVAMFVAGDERTPHDEVRVLCEELSTSEDGSATYYSPEHQRTLGYACSELIGWNCIQRRNIAFLEALKWEAEVVVSIDDDNLPINAGFFIPIEFGTGEYRYYGLCARSPSGWLDQGRLLSPPASQRGFPVGAVHGFTCEPVVGAKVEVVAGTCLGDPDVSAVTRIANRPEVHGASELLRAGIIVHPETRMVFNSQTTALAREIVPAFFLPPGVGRMDDIFASLVCRRIMRERGTHVRVGPPFVWQTRNEHDLAVDLREEQWGTENVARFSEHLNAMPLGRVGESVVEQVRYIYSHAHNILPERAVEAAMAWCDDIEALWGQD